MRGNDQQQGHVFSYISPEQRVAQGSSAAADPHDGRQGTPGTLAAVNRMYSKVGRPSIPPEQLLRRFCFCRCCTRCAVSGCLTEETDYNILFRWFVGLNLDDEVWDATVFTKNRNRLLEAEVAKDFLALVVDQAREQGWASDEHFSVTGVCWKRGPVRRVCQRKNQKGRLRQRIPEIPRWNYRGEQRSNATHESKKRSRSAYWRVKGAGKEAKLSYQRESAGGESQWLDRVEPGVGSNGIAERYAALESCRSFQESDA